MTAKSLIGVATLVALASLSGCASIVDGAHQPVTVKTVDQAGNEVQGASCQLSNKKGHWSLATPATVTVHQSHDSLVIDCSKPGMPEGVVDARPRIKKMALGNAVFGGPYGAVIDGVYGAAFGYPPAITVIMGEHRLIKPKYPPMPKPPGAGVPPAIAN